MDKQKKPIRIAIVVDIYSHGGVAVALRDLLRELEKESYQVTLFIHRFDPARLLPLPEGVEVRPWEPAQPFALPSRLLTLLNWRNYSRKTVYQTRGLKMFPGEYDCAIGYNMALNDVTVVALEKIRAKRKILWLHAKKTFRDKDLAFYDALYAKADQIVCVSLETEARFRGLMPSCADKTVTIHNFYDIPSIRSQAQLPAEGMDHGPGSMSIVSVGRLSREKGFDRVPAVAEKLLHAGYGFRWYIIGDGDKRAEIEAAIRDRHLEDRVRLLGHRSNPFPYVQQCDIYVQPSYTEGFCTSTMEAKILYKPVVTTDVPGMGEQFVSGENGLIVESSVDGLVSGIRQLLDAPELREKIVENLRREPISNEETLRRTIAVINGAQQ